MRLDLFVEVDAQEHPQKRQKIHLERKADSDREQNKVDNKGRVNAWLHGGRKNPLNCSFLRGHHPQDFPEDAPEQSSNEDKKQ